MNDLSSHPTLHQGDALNRIANEAVNLGCEIVEIAAALDNLAQVSASQTALLREAEQAAHTVQDANREVLRDAEVVTGAVDASMTAVRETVGKMRQTDENARLIAGWVQSVVQKMAEVTQTLATVQSENAEIRSIATQVNILAINAKIEAVRAGDAGRGFAVVAEAINELSRKTASAADGIGTAVHGLSDRITQMRKEAVTISDHADAVMTSAGETDSAMTRMTASVDETRSTIRAITQRAEQVRKANQRFAPAFERMARGAQETAHQTGAAQKRTNALITVGETIVQESIQIGGTTSDSGLIETATQTAQKISALFRQAIEAGEISEADLFDQTYVPIPDTNPQQVTTRFTAFTDKHLASLQETLLGSDPKIVFCAAVDRNGYLPTHNKAFSQPQSKDPSWNAAHCRNRRIFNDRVGLRAGRSSAPFVLQIYRRDMGGGDFVLMKDLSAPIHVGSRHWGGFRIGYKF